MSVNLPKEEGNITIIDEVISNIAGVSATECFGVVGMASKNLKDGFAELLKKENYSKGIVVRSKENEIEVDLHVILGYGMKISEICVSIQQKVKFNLEEMLGVKVNCVNILVQGIKIIDETPKKA